MLVTWSQKPLGRDLKMDVYKYCVCVCMCVCAHARLQNTRYKQNVT